ncbi:hypothetical protein J6590_087674 [Homalodisca vitripennis]|nr:hypothetical protein J6590_087674 [Homalodisca vitripennis]
MVNVNGWVPFPPARTRRIVKGEGPLTVYLIGLLSIRTRKRLKKNSTTEESLDYPYST